MEVQMKRLFLCLVFALAFGPNCSGQSRYDSLIDRVRNAPFSAEVQGWNTSRDSPGMWRTQIGRASDGSTYIAQIEAIPEFKSSDIRTGIFNAASNCGIGFHPYQVLSTKSTSKGVTPFSATGFQITVGGGSASGSPTRTLEDIRRGYSQLQEIFRRIPQTSDSDGTGENYRTTLGVKMAYGTTIYGFRDERTHDRKRERVEEHWESELGFRFSESWSNPNTESNWGYRVTSLKQVEPPPECFALKEEYFPPTQALANAKTLFLPEFHGHEKLLRRIEAILTASGRFTVLPNADVADLAVRIQTSTATSVSMSLREPSEHEQYIGDLLTIVLDFDRLHHVDGKSDDWAEAPVVNTCFARLWQQVEKLQTR
jgi:hypothetical protein